MTSIDIELSPDRMMASVILPLSSGVASIDREAVMQSLEDSGVCHGVDEDGVAKLVAHLRGESEEVLSGRVVLARGTPPIKGKDGELRYLLTHGSPAGLKFADGHVDAHNQQQGQDVRAGDLLAELTAPEKGVNGKTVCGEVLVTKAGRAYRMRSRENVRVTEGGTLFHAQIDGVHFLVNGCIRVTATYDVRGDVDYHTGDIETSHAASVSGDVHSTFRVKASGDVDIRGHVDDGTVEAGGSIHVGGGISREHTGMVRSLADVHAMYAVNAEIRASGSIEFTDNTYNSHLLAGSTIRVVEGSGAIVGGRATATQNIEVKVAGSRVGVPTLLRVGCDLRCVEAVEKKLGPIEQEIARLHGLLGIGTQKAGRSEPARAAKALAHLTILDRRRQVLLDQRERCLQESSASMEGAPFVLVHDRVMPGVEFVIGNASLKVSEESPGGRFALNQETGAIEPEWSAA